MTAIDPDFCYCGVPIEDVSLGHYLSCGDDGFTQDEAQHISGVLAAWADRELRAMGEEP